MNRRVQREIIYFCGVVIVGLFCVEGLLRVKNTTPSTIPFVSTTDRMLLKEPNRNMLLRSESGKVVRVSTNEYGFSGPSLSAASHIRTSSRPIVFLGDSFTQALQVDDEKKFTNLVARQLLLGTSTVPVFNLALDGGTVLEDVAVYKKFVSVIRPQLTVLVVSPHIYELVDVSYREYLLSTDFRDISIDRLLGEKVDMYQASQTPFRNFLRQFHVVRYLAELVRTHVRRPTVSGVISTAQQTLVRSPFAVETATLSDTERAQIQLVIDVIKKMHHTIKNDGGQFALVVIPESRDIHGEKRESPNTLVIDALCGTVPLMDVTPAFFSAIHRDRVQVYINDHGHLTEAGHEVMAKEVGAFIQSLIQQDAFAGQSTLCLSQ